MRAEDIALKFLDLGNLEIEEMLTSLFRKVGYRVVETSLFHDILYLHLNESKEDGLKHTLACWVTDRKKLSPDEAAALFKKIPPTLSTGTRFESAILLTPFQLTAGEREGIKPTGIEIADGANLLNLLAKYEVPYRVPNFWNALANRYGKKLPYILTPIFLLAAFFLYKVLNPSNASTMTPPVAIQTPAPTTTPTPTPTFTPTPTPTLTPTPTPTFTPTPTPTLTPTPTSTPTFTPKPVPARAATHKRKKTARAPRKKQTAAKTAKQAPPQPKPKPVRPKKRAVAGKVPKNIPYNSRSRIEGRVERHYAHIFDLDEKYYRMAADFQHRKLYSLAREYYGKYLQISPSGVHAAAAEQALKTLPRK